MRTLLRTMAVATCAGLIAAACGGDDPPPGGGTAAPGGERLKVGLLTPGLTNDGSFNQVALEAVQKLADEGLIEFEVREQMHDPTASEPVIRQFATQGFDLVIGHGIELGEPVLRVAADFPDVNFTISGGADVVEKPTDNVEAWTYDFNQQGFLSGFVAGSIDGASTVGIVGGPQLPFIEAAHAGFRLGVADTSEGVQVLEVYAGSFDDVQRANEAANGLISQGATVLYCSGDGICNGVAAAANAAGNVLTIGVRGEAGGLGVRVNVASVDLDMYPTYRSYVDRTLSDDFGNEAYISGLANRGLVLTPVNVVNDRVPADLQSQVGQLVADLASGARQLPTS